MNNERTPFCVSHSNEGIDKRPSLTLWDSFRESPVLNNKGSTARDHLANERTYLAWIRTSLSLIGASIAVLKFDVADSVEGYMLGLIGVTALMSSTRRYFSNMERLERGEFEPNVRSIFSVVFIVMICVVTAFALHFVRTKEEVLPVLGK